MRLYLGACAALLLMACPSPASAQLFPSNEIKSRNEMANRAQAIWFADQVLQSGATPANWPNRAFIPASTLRAVAGPLVGTEYILPNGNVDRAGHALGFVHFKLKALSLEPVDGRLTASVVIDAFYKADKERPWWRGAKAQLLVKALVIPAGSGEEKGKPATYFRLAPVSIKPKVSFGILNLRANKFVSELIALGAIEKFGDKALVAVPSIAQELEVSTAIASETYSKFSKSGGFRQVTTYGGDTYKQTYVMDRTLVTGSGIWLLGGAPAVPPSPPPPQDIAGLTAWLATREPGFPGRLAGFQSQDGLLRVHLSKDPLEELVGRIRAATAGGVPIGLTTRDATGVVGEAYLLKDKLLGDVGLRVTPARSDFAKGELKLAIGRLDWVPGTGLAGTAAAVLTAQADLDVHLSTAFVGGGIGKEFRIKGETSTSVPFSLSLKLYKMAAGNALVLQPALGCRRVEFDVHPTGTGKLIDEPWAQLDYVGVRIKRNLGDGTIRPSVVLSSLREFQSFNPKAEPGERLNFPSKGIAYRVTPVGLTIGDRGVELTAQAEITASNGLDADRQRKEEQALREAIALATPAPDCDANQELALLVGDFEIGKNNEVIAFIVNMYKAGEKVAKSTIDEIEKAYKKPIDSIKDMPENVIREGGRAVENVGREAARGGRKVCRVVFRHC